jgi:hypothetical protein
MNWPVLTLTVKVALVMVRVWNWVLVANAAIAKIDSVNSGTISLFIRFCSRFRISTKR